METKVLGKRMRLWYNKYSLYRQNAGKAVPMDNNP